MQNYLRAATCILVFALSMPTCIAADKLLCGTPKLAAYEEANKLKAFPHRQELVANELWVNISLHKLPGGDSRQAWSFVSEGLAPLGQPEMVITIIKRDTEKELDAPHDPITFFKTVYQLAKENKLAFAGSITELAPNPKGFIAPQFVGTVYLPARPLDGVTLPDDALAAVAITREELDVQAIGGASRVGARLSKQDKYYPYPTWCDRDRKSAFTADEVKTMKAEPINEAPSASLYSAGIVADATKLNFYVPQDAHEPLVEILKKLPKDAPIKLTLGVDPRANAFLLWSTGQAQAVAPPKSDASLMGGSYIEILPGVEKTEFGRFNDGYVVMLTDEEWTKIKTAITDKKDISITATTGGEFIDFTVTFPMVAYRSPIDRQNYEANWRTYMPDGKDKAASPSTSLEKIILLTDQNLIASYMDATTLSN